MAITNSTIAQAVNDLVEYWDALNLEYATWLAGSVGGGPGLDGKYPLTDYLGNVRMTDCPAQLEDNVNSLVAGAQGYSDAADASATAAAASAAAAATSAGEADSDRLAAQSAQTAAESAQSAAESARTTAIAQAGVATTQASAASASAAAALASENAAALSETNAATSESNAATSATNADLERQYAAEWANKAEDVLVSSAAGGDQVDDYSAFHWAQKAEDFAAAADLLSTADEIITGNWSFDHASGLNIGAGIVTAAKIAKWDAVDATGITDGYVLTADGAGNAGWEVAAGGIETSDSPTLTGTWTFTNRVDFTRAAVAGVYGSTVNIYNTNPQVSIRDTGAAVDEGVWNIIGGVTDLKIRTLSDDFGTAVDAMTFNRTGTAFDGVQVATNVQIDGDGELLTLKNTNHLSSDVLLNSWIRWKDSAGTDMAWIGHGSNSNNDFGIYHSISGNNIRMGTVGAGDVLMTLGATGALEITGSSYKTNPTGLRLGQYTSTIGYIQAPAGGRIAMWNDGTGEIASFNDDNSVTFGTGAGGLNGGVTGTYGSIQTTGSKSGYGGVSLDGNFVLMNSGSSHVGLYDDINNEWFFLAYPNSYVRLYHNGSYKLTTESTGIQVIGVGEFSGGTEIPTSFADQNVIGTPSGPLGNDILHVGYQVRGGAFDATTSSYTGYCRIRFPVSVTNDSCMMTMMIHGYNYSGTDGTIDGGHWCIAVSGYFYSTENWHNTSARIVTGSPPFDIVRFGEDEVGDYKYILLGESTTQWDYPKVWLTDLTGGHSTQYTDWLNGTWQIDFSASLPSNYSDDATASDYNIGGQIRWDGEDSNNADTKNLGGRVRITTASPTGGQNGDIWFKY